MLDSDGPRKTSTMISLFDRIFPRRRRALTEEELQEVIEASEAEGIINEGEGDMLHSIFEFGETIVREVMVPRTDMVNCPLNATLPHLLEAIISSGHSRIPIFEGTNDRIVGVVYAKDLLRYWGKDTQNLRIADVMREPYFVPETKNVEDLLLNFRTKRVHMAIVIDEYGGTSGLITIEDLLEEIVGDIQDEYDTEEEWLVAEADGAVLVDGRLNVVELEEYFNIEIPRDKFDTVGGYLVNHCGHVPAIGEEIMDGGLILTVIAADQRKIGKVRARRAPLSAGQEHGE